MLALRNSCPFAVESWFSHSGLNETKDQMKPLVVLNNGGGFHLGVEDGQTTACRGDYCSHIIDLLC